MRTTVTIADDLMLVMRRRCADSGESFKDVLNLALRAGLDAMSSRRPPRAYRLRTFPLGRPAFGFTTRTEMAGDLETEEIGRKLDMNK